MKTLSSTDRPLSESYETLAPAGDVYIRAAESNFHWSWAYEFLNRIIIIDVVLKVILLLCWWRGGGVGVVEFFVLVEHNRGLIRLSMNFI